MTGTRDGAPVSRGPVQPHPRESMRPDFALANADFVTDRLAVGGDLAPNFRQARAQLAELVAAGITHIADLRSEWSDESLVRNWAPQLEYLHHRVEDAGQEIGGDWFATLADWVDAALAKPGTKVLIHCHMGVNRAPSAALAVLLHQGVGLRQALDAIRQARPVAVIDYADNALEAHLIRSGADPRQRRNARRTLARWRQAHELDARSVIRAIRDTEHPGHHWLVRLGPDDHDSLARLLAESGDVAVALSVDVEPQELSQLDDVLLLTTAGLVGRSLVVGPIQPAEPYALLLPVLVTNLFPAVELALPEAVGEWLEQTGPNPRLLADSEYLALAVR